VTSTTWTPLNKAEKDAAISRLTNTTLQYLHDFDPNSGSYVNKASPCDLEYQNAFWESNYARLVEIKRAVDPEDVFWCQLCVGGEGWEMVNGRVCQV